MKRGIEMAFIEFKNIIKKFDDHIVLKGIDFSIEKGSLVTLLGPSGCGKSTLLRCLAGLEDVTEGEIYLDGKNITNLQPQERGIGMVFQQYSLFPNMNVYENIAFPLKQKKTHKDKIQQKVLEALKMVDLVGREQAYPHELSGGQQQRVALARSIVQEPKVLLLDEPLSAIDAKLRKSLQEKIKYIQKKLGITTIFVTHDQDEAMIMSDCIYLFNQGNIEQSGSPVDIYTAPKTKFAAEFIGNYNIIESQLLNKIFPSLSLNSSYVAIRPETIQLSKEKILDADYVGEAAIVSYLSHGNVLRYSLRCQDIKLHADVLFRSFTLYEPNSSIYFGIDQHNILEVSENAII
jgi:putative spermidine/putrescine transport system ATP-binding protein